MVKLRRCVRKTAPRKKRRAYKDRVVRSDHKVIAVQQVQQALRVSVDHKAQQVARPVQPVQRVKKDHKASQDRQVLKANKAQQGLKVGRVQQERKDPRVQQVSRASVDQRANRGNKVSQVQI